MDAGQTGSGRGFPVLRQAGGIQRKDEHGPPRGGQAVLRNRGQGLLGRGFRNPHRSLPQHRETEECRHYRKGDAEADGRSPVNSAAHRGGDASGIRNEGKGTGPPFLRTPPDTFSPGLERPGQGHLPAQVRGALLPAAFPPQAEIHPEPGRERDKDAPGGRAVQQVLRRSPIYSYRSTETGYPRDSGRHAERPPDEPPAPGRRGFRQNHGSRPLGPDRRGKRPPGLHYGTNGSTCTAALCKHLQIPSPNRGQSGSPHRVHPRRSQEGHPRRTHGRQHRDNSGHPRADRGHGAVPLAGTCNHRRAAPLWG